MQGDVALGRAVLSENLARQMSSQQLPSTVFPHLLLLSLWCECRQREIECLKKGSGRLYGSLIQRLGFLALYLGRHNRAQWPLSRWLDDQACNGVGHLLGIGRGRRAVLGVKRRHKRSHRSLVEAKTLVVCCDLAVGTNG